MSNVNNNPDRLELGSGESIHKSVMEFKKKENWGLLCDKNTYYINGLGTDKCELIIISDGDWISQSKKGDKFKIIDGDYYLNGEKVD
jgi:hypothetical protein